MENFTKKELNAFITYDVQRRCATISAQFLYQEHICIMKLLACVENFKNNILKQKNISFIDNPHWPTQHIKIILCIDKVIVIDSAWLGEMIKMYKEDWDMQSIVSDILSLFILCDQFAIAQEDDTIIQFDAPVREDRTAMLENILNNRRTMP